MDIGGTWSLLRTHWVTITAAALLTTIVAAGYLLLTPPEFSARSELFLAVENGSTTQELSQGSNYSQQQARNYSALATRAMVLEPVVTKLNLTETPSQLSRKINASVPLNTSLITITVTDTDPQRAQAIANAAGDSLADSVRKLVPSRRDGTSPVKLQVVQPAVAPTAPSTPSGILVLVFAALVGLLLGVGFLVIRERVSAKVRSADQLKHIDGVTVLGSIAYDRRALTHPMLPAGAETPRAEEFRQVRTNVRFLQTDQAHKAFVVTSAISGEGKSTTAANLAATLAASGSSVCLVEADYRRPRLQSYLDLEGSVGLTSVITGEVTLDEALQPWGPDNLQVLLAGDIPPNPSEVLGSAHAEAAIRELTERFDVTIIDCPPLLPVTDAALVAKLIGGAVLVVGTGRVGMREFRRASDNLASVGAQLLGVIVNFVPQGAVGHYRQLYRDETRRVQWDTAGERHEAA